jgi:uncharacterized protein (DUF486 family)
MYESVKRPTNALVCMIVILLHDNHRYALATYGHLQAAKNKNTLTVIMCQNQSAVKKSVNFG